MSPSDKRCYEILTGWECSVTTSHIIIHYFKLYLFRCHNKKSNYMYGVFLCTIWEAWIMTPFRTSDGSDHIVRRLTGGKKWLPSHCNHNVSALYCITRLPPTVTTTRQVRTASYIWGRNNVNRSVMNSSNCNTLIQQEYFLVLTKFYTVGINCWHKLLAWHITIINTCVFNWWRIFLL